MNGLTLILPYYRNRSMLDEHCRIWAAYPAELRQALHVVVVDDCSPVDDCPSPTAADPPIVASIQLYRITTKVRWNWLACRNLGASKAPTAWVLFTDIDHVLPAETLRALLAETLDDRSVYRLHRVDAPRPWPYRLEDCPVRQQKRVHPNTWLMTRAMFDRIGGYDERLSGCYGTDGEFRDRVQAKARAVVLLSEMLVRYPREILPDASTTEFTRKNDPANDEELRARRARRDGISGWVPLRGTFPYERVA